MATLTRDEANAKLRANYESFMEEHYGACMEYAFIDAGSPVKTIQDEARDFFGESVYVTAYDARAIWDEIEHYNFPRAGYARFIDGDSFMKIVAMFVEV